MRMEDLLGEVEDVIRTMPPAEQLHHDSAEILEWCGRAAAVMNAAGLGVPFTGALANLPNRLQGHAAMRDVQRLLHQARYSLRMTTLGPISTAIGAGAVFDYFDEVRKVIEGASTDLLFVDPYLDAEFVSRYLPHVKNGVRVRLLTRKVVDQLVPAAQAYKTQHGTTIEVRSSADMHDRFVIVDGSACYQSGASFKDGAKKSPTTLTQITDAFAVVKKQYEDRWQAGTVHI
jgi:hypothetical protein